MSSEIDMTRVLVDLEQKPIPTGEGDGVWTVGKAIGQALVFMGPNERIPARDQETRFLLAMRIYPADTVELDTAEVRTIKDALAVRFSPLIAGQVGLVLDGKL